MALMHHLAGLLHFSVQLSAGGAFFTLLARIWGEYLTIYPPPALFFFFFFFKWRLARTH